MRLSLPIDLLLPRIVESLRGNPNLVLQADPGAGKTTRVPPALLEAGLLGEGECWILEPRRLAARLAATRVANELGETLGQRAGYAVRFEQKVSRATRLRFVTEGLLLRRLQDDPGLRGIAAVVLDEFHERHLHTDLGITLLRGLQREARPDLKLLVMSATLDPGPVAAFLDAPVMKSEGRAFPVTTTFLARPDDRPIEQQVSDALARLYGEGLRNHTLVFLPGAAEIRACLKGCEAVAVTQGLSLRPLHGELSPDAQAHALELTDTPKIIFSTNVAESSVTLDGIGAVVDSGLGREASHSPWSGLSGLRTVRIAQARCTQRTGRAGRTGPGRCLRLYTEADFGTRPAFDTPELQRSDLAEPLLALHGMGIAEPGALIWFESPPAKALSAAEALLERLGALEQGTLSPLGRRMAKLPLHPRLARLAVAGEDLGVPQLALRAAALLETGSLLARQGLDRPPVQTGHGAESDLLLRLDQFEEAKAGDFSAGACRAAGLDAAALQRARRAVQSLERFLPASAEPADAEVRLLRALLRAYPDRVGQLSANGTCAFAGGGGAKLDPASRVRRPGLILALEAEAVKQVTGAQTLIRLASRCEADWLLEAFPEHLEEADDVLFNPPAGRVEQRSELRYNGLTIDTSRGPADPSDPRVASLLAEALRNRPLDEVPARFLARLAFLRRHRPELDLPEDLLGPLLAGACRGRTTMRELQDVDWPAALRQAFPAETLRLLDTWAPEAIQLPKGRPTKVHYEADPPWIASRLQDFWGLKKSPTVAGGAVPLVLHLLAPNMRAVQVTTDLGGFWQRVYKELRPGLSRRTPSITGRSEPLLQTALRYPFPMPTLRPIRPEDDAAVAAIIRRVMPEFGADGPGFAIHDPEVDHMSEAYSVPGATFFVVVDESGKILGGAGIAPLLGGEPGVCELRKMYFLPEARGKGTGEALLSQCLEVARNLGYWTCYLETLTGMDQAIRLYTRLGFRPLGSPLGHTGHGGCDHWYSRELGCPDRRVTEQSPVDSVESGPGEEGISEGRAEA